MLIGVDVFWCNMWDFGVDKYMVGWICVFLVEMVVVKVMFDEVYGCFDVDVV